MKHIAVLAVLAAVAVPASAQSSVTIYGLIDLGVFKGNGGTALNDFALGTSKAWTLQQRSSSRLGFKGNEDLGGGLSAQFQIESRFSPDTGNQTNPATFYHGRSYVQLSSKNLGQVYAGREYSPAYWPAYFTDPAGWDGVGTLGRVQYVGFSSTANLIRTNNTVGYRSPNIGGLTSNAAVSLGETTAGRDSAINAQYRSGPLYVGLAYEKITGGPVAASAGNSLANIGASYNFGFVKPMIYFAHGKTAGNTLSNNAASIAAVAPVGGGVGSEVYIAYGRLNPDGINNTITKLGVGYKVRLSKRTNLYADVGRGHQSGKTNNTATDFGIRHDF